MKSSIHKTGNKYLLDTNIIVEIFGGNVKIADKVHSLNGFAICPIVLGELYIGVNRVKNKNKHLKLLDSFMQLCTLLDVNDETALHYGAIMAQLHKKGKPIPTNDVWIAAVAQQYGYTLVTADKHFDEIGELAVTKW